MALVAQETRVTAAQLRTLCAAMLEKLDVPAEDAALTAETLVEADLRGVTSHGTRALPRYLRSIQKGGTKARPDVRVLREGPAFAVMDGGAGLGQVVAHRAMSKAIELAKRSGVGAVAVDNSNHYGAAAYWAMMASSRDMIGVATTNGGGKNMAAFGGAQPVVGNSPLAFAAPSRGEPPIVLDMATGVVAQGKIGVAQMRGEKIPLGWGLTAEGEPTDDPAKATIVLPLGPKGYGLALMMDVLSGPLRGAVMSVRTGGFNLQGDPKPPNAGHFFLALDVAQFTDLEAFKDEQDEAIRAIRASKPQRGVERVYLPGEIEWNSKLERSKSGIPLHPLHSGALAEMARELKVGVPWSLE